MAEVVRGPDRADSIAILAAPNRTEWKVTIGSIATQELVQNKPSGSESIEIQTNDGKVTLDACCAVLRIIQMCVDPVTVEQFRKDWRGAFLGPVKKSNMPVDRLKY